MTATPAPLARVDRTPTTVAGTQTLAPTSALETRAYAVTAVEGTCAGRRWTPKSPCTIGSVTGNSVVLDDPTVSRFHCELTGVGAGVRVRDLESKNGCSLDGMQIGDAVARHGSLLRLGRTVLRIERLHAIEQRPLSTAASFGALVGSSVAMRAAYALLERAAREQVTILLQGETGTGKELAARAIHAASPRFAGPFVVVDCGSIPASLLESELFGHERGAFTGATTRRPGAFERARGGTLFLDEIGELPLDAQPKILRALEAREVRPVGGSQAIPVDLRVIAATHRDLRAAANTGAFRSDLYFRIGGLAIELPPLRERPEDLEAIALALLHDLDPTGAASSLLTPALVAELAASSWPGNVRELRNFLHRCVVVGDHRLPLPPRRPTPRLDVELGVPLKEARRRVLDDFERQYLEALLDQHAGNMSATARAAGIGRVTLYATLERLGIRTTRG
jgi:two-component system, NtrC family, response regulator GlrR